MDSKLRHTSSNIAEVVIVVAILALANYLGYTFFQRIDLTENKQYTISQATKGVLRSLDDPVNIEFFLSSDLPPQLMSLRNIVRDKLQEYVAYGRGKLKLKVTDPGDDQAEKDRASQLGVPELEFNIPQKDQITIMKAFFGLVMSFEDKTETIRTNELTDPTALEYALTSRLKKLTMDRKPKIGLYQGPFTTSQQQQAPSYEVLRGLLAGQEGLYDMEMIDAESARQLPEGLDGLIIAGTHGLSESMKYSIDQFLMNGGQVLVALEATMQPSQQGVEMTAYPSLPTIEDQLEKYGIKFTKNNMVVDPSCAKASIPTGFITVYRDYYLWPRIGPKGFNDKVGAVAQLESMVMPWCCPISEIQVQGAEFSPLAWSSESSFAIDSPFSFNPDQDWMFLQSTAEATGPFNLVCMVSGDIPSAFPEGPPPGNQPGDAEEPVTLELEFEPGTHKLMASGDGRLVVMSSAVALSDGFMREFRENALFIANVVDMLLMGEELAGIRSTPVTARPLKQLTDAQKSFYRWIDVLGVPVLLVLFGLLLWFLKGQRRKAIAARYGG